MLDVRARSVNDEMKLAAARTPSPASWATMS
jgi:malic enzyme